MRPLALDHPLATEKLLASFRTLFEEEPTYVSDSDVVLEVVSAQAVRTMSIDDLLRRDPGVSLGSAVMIATNAASFPAIGSFEAHLKNSAVLVVPLMAFDGSEAATRYTLQRLARTDFATCVRMNREWMGLLETAEGRVRLLGPGTEADLELSPDITVMSPKLQPSISRGEWTSVAQFLEVGLVPSRSEISQDPAGYRPSFHLSGRIRIDGCVVAHHRHRLAEAAPNANAAWGYLRGLHEEDWPLTVELADSAVMAVLTAQGRNVFPELQTYIDNPSGRYLAEFALASDSYDSTVDWTMNSQMNEAAGGVHVAVGQGIRGAHIDFVAPLVEVGA